MMTSKQDIDCLIIGQGLAGSLLAWQLIQRGLRVVVIADEAALSASRTAAGLFNPITGKRVVLQPHADEVIRTARSLYASLEQQFGQQLFHSKPMLRIIRDEKELEQFEKRCLDPAYRPYLGRRLPTPDGLHAPNGVFEQLQTGYLDTNALIDCMREYLIDKEAYQATHFQHDELNVYESAVSWHDISATRAIFCEGFMAVQNPWFSWLPFQPAKGEILTLKTDAPLPVQIINGGRWLLPIGNGFFKTGATYSHDLSETEPSASGRGTLLAGMQKLLRPHITYELIEHKAGVRPNTLDKYPFIGAHPEHPAITIFNGFGSKGSMLIPYYSERFADHLTAGSEIPHEADIRRIDRG